MMKISSIKAMCLFTLFLLVGGAGPWLTSSAFSSSVAVPSSNLHTTTTPLSSHTTSLSANPATPDPPASTIFTPAGGLLYYTWSNDTAQYRSFSPLSIGTTNQTVSDTMNANGSVTISYDELFSGGYLDTGIVWYLGSLGNFRSITVSNSTDIGMNLWIDANNDGQFFSWVGNTEQSGYGGDGHLLYGETNTINQSTISHSMGGYSAIGCPRFAPYTVSELQHGVCSGITNSTEIAAWIGIGTFGGYNSGSTVINTVNGAAPATQPSNNCNAVVSSGGASIQTSINGASSGSEICVGPGIYNESPNIGKSLTLESAGGPNVTTINLQPNGPTYLGSLEINAPNVTVDGFTITGFNFNATAGGLASTNIFVTTVAQYVVIQNNRFLVGEIGPKSNGDDGMGIITTSTTSSNVSSVIVTGNVFEPLNSAGGRAFYINPGVTDFLFSHNTIVGNFTGASIAQADHGLVENNIVQGNGSSAGFGTWGYPNASVYGHTTFAKNRISGTDAGISIWETNDVKVLQNTLEMNAMGVWVGNFTGLPFNGSTISISHNTFRNNTVQYVDAVSTTNIQQILLSNTFDRAVTVLHSGQPLHTIWSKIADGVGNASSGDTVMVAPGNYSGGITINKPLTLLGAQAGVNAQTRSGVPESVIMPGGISVDAVNVTVNGFTIQNSATMYNDIGISNPGASILNNIMYTKPTSSSPSALSANGIYIDIAPTLGTEKTVVSHNLFLAAGPEGSVIAGIFAERLSNTFIAGNTFAENGSYEASIVITGRASNVTIEGNDQIAPGTTFVALFSTTDSSVIGNTINGAGDYPGTTSIYIGGGDNGTYVAGNTIENSPVAIDVQNAYGAGNNSNVYVTRNNLRETNGIGLRVNASAYVGTLNATYNYWGCPTGANTTGCSTLYGAVNYIPSLSLPINTPTATLTFIESGLAPGTPWSVTITVDYYNNFISTTYSTDTSSISIPNMVVLNNNTYLTEFAQGQYNFSVSVAQPYALAFWGSNTTSITFMNRIGSSTAVSVNGSGTITVTFGPVSLDQSFTPTAALNETVVGTIQSVNATWRNNLLAQQTGIVWFEVENNQTGQTMMITATSLTLNPGESLSAYLGLSTLAPGTYRIQAFVTTSSGVPVSESTAFVVTA